MEIHLIAIDFDEHETAVGVEFNDVKIARAPDVVVTQLSRFTLKEEIDALLRFQVLIDMFMSAPHSIHAVLGEERHEPVAKVDVGTVILCTGEQRVMEVCNLPFRIRTFQLVFEP